MAASQAMKAWGTPSLEQKNLLALSTLESPFFCHKVTLQQQKQTYLIIIFFVINLLLLLLLFNIKK